MINRFKMILLISGLFLSSFTSFAFINKDPEWYKDPQQWTRRGRAPGLVQGQRNERLIQTMERDLLRRAAFRLLNQILQRSKIKNQLTAG